MIIAIAGASGLTGSYCLPLLLQDNRINAVYSFARRPTGIQHPKLTELPLEKEMPAPCDAFICCLGTTMAKASSKEAFEEIDWHLPLRLAKRAKAAGATHAAIVSAMQANPQSRIFYSRTKGNMEEEIKTIGFQALHILRPSFIGGPRQERRPLEMLFNPLLRLVGPLLFGNARHYRLIEASTIAAALVNCIKDPAAGTFIHLSENIKTLARS